jgi:hypothetical protein
MSAAAEPVMHADVTFEIHVFRGGRWEVVDIFAEREQAIAFARANVARFQAIQVKAEHYDPRRGVYVSSTVFREGTATKADKPLQRVFRPRVERPRVKEMDLPTPVARPLPPLVASPSWMDRLRALVASWAGAPDRS